MSNFGGFVLSALVVAIVLVSPLYATLMYAAWKKDMSIMKRALEKVGIGARYVYVGLDWLYRLVNRVYIPFMVGYVVCIVGMYQAFNRAPEYWRSLPADTNTMLLALLILVVINKFWVWVFNFTYDD